MIAIVCINTKGRPSRYETSSLGFSFFSLNFALNIKILHILKEEMKDERKICMWKPLLFFSVWLSITVPLLLIAVFTIFQSLLIFDQSGTIMLGILFVVTVGNVYLGTRVWLWIEDKLYKRKHSIM